MKVIHILADGSVNDDLTGYEVKPKIAGDFYNVLSRICGTKPNEKTNENKN